ncbi:MAG: hypothetical protein V4544_00170 [Pseudomonadota bacterium]
MAFFPDNCTSTLGEGLVVNSSSALKGTLLCGINSSVVNSIYTLSTSTYEINLHKNILTTPVTNFIGDLRLSGDALNLLGNITTTYSGAISLSNYGGVFLCH